MTMTRLNSWPINYVGAQTIVTLRLFLLKK